MPMDLSLLLRYLHQVKGETLNQLQKLYPQHPQTTIYRHMKKPLAEIGNSGKNIKRKCAGHSGGRQRLGSERDLRKIGITLLKHRATEGNFS